MTYNPNPAVVDHIAALVVQACPEWDLLLVRVVLNSHAPHVDGTDLAIASLRAATTDRFRSMGPRAIGWRGPHWDGLGTMPPEIAASAARCDTCGKSEERCYSTRVGIDDDHAFLPARHLVDR